MPTSATGQSGPHLDFARRIDALEQLAALSEKDREALLLTAWDGLSTDQTATLLGISAAAVRNRVMFYSIFKHRKSVGHQAAQFHENTHGRDHLDRRFRSSSCWSWRIPATKTILAMKDTSAPDMTIKVTGYQWKWGYDYLQEGFGFYSNLSTPLAQIENREPKGEHYLLEVDNPLVVPVGTKVRVLITAGDVIHAWWVPAFGVKQDAIPGLRARRLVQGRQGRHLPRPVRRAVRQGARLHADRRRGEVEGRLRQVGRRAEEEARRRRRRPEQGMGR